MESIIFGLIVPFLDGGDVMSLLFALLLNSGRYQFIQDLLNHVPAKYWDKHPDRRPRQKMFWKNVSTLDGSSNHFKKNIYNDNHG